MKSYIYSLSCPNTNNVRYVGRTINVENRFRSHISQSIKNKVANKGLMNWILDLLREGQEPLMQVLKECTSNDVSEYEAFYIDMYNKENLLLNMDKFSSEHKCINTKELKAIVKSRKIKINAIAGELNIKNASSVSSFLSGRKWSLSIDKAKMVRDYILKVPNLSRTYHFGLQ